MRRTIPIACLIVCCLAPGLAEAGTGGGSLPWETPLEAIRDSVTGPVAYAISLMGIVVAGAMLVWGGEIGDFVRRIIMLTLAISLIVFSANILATLFSVSGAVIP
jgi:type IV secretion system protein VirB2